MPRFHLGIDVAKAKLDCARRRPDGKRRSKRVENTPIGFIHSVTWLASEGADSVPACMEATGTDWEALQAMRIQEHNRLEVAREALRASLQTHPDWLDQEIKRVIQAIRDYIDSHPGLKDQRDLLDRVPGLKRAYHCRPAGLLLPAAAFRQCPAGRRLGRPRPPPP